ncbi:protein CASC3-like isoform X2 [Acanthaster planci]|uniref:Protein CASC3 n=1 Tax=Acanthaster planci TaxID=133434 RepID=A0A8B8A3D0_ACAPL|nr:protein CASC3-like isoform X2 [Acanthaster planci]
MADTRRRREPRRRQDDIGAAETEEDGENVSVQSDAESHSDAESDTIFDKEEGETDEYESAEEAQEEGGEPPNDSDEEDKSQPDVGEGDAEGGNENENVNDEENQADEAAEEETDGDKRLDADEDLKNPAYIPRRGPYFMHDVRSMDNKEEDKEKDRGSKEKKLWKEDNKWLHDKYFEAEQAPKPRAEMVSIYGYDIRSSNEPPKTGQSRQPRRAPRGRSRGRQRYNLQESFNNQKQPNKEDGYSRKRQPAQRSEPAQEDWNDENEPPAPTETIGRQDSYQGQSNGEESNRTYDHERPWSGRTRGRGRGRRGRGQGRESYDHSRNAVEPATIPHKTEWVNSNSGPSRREQVAGQRRDWHHRLPEADRQRQQQQRVPLQEDFPALGASQLSRKQEPARLASRETVAPQWGRKDRREQVRESGEGDWAKAVAKTGRQNVGGETKERSSEGGSLPAKSQGLLPTPSSTEGRTESPEDSNQSADRMQADKREPLKPKRYSSQRQRQAADAPPISQASAVVQPPKFYQGEATGPPPGYSHTPPATSSPQHMGGGGGRGSSGGGGTPPHTLQSTAPSVHGGATPPGMGVAPSTQAPPTVMQGGVMPQGIILPGDVPIHPGMRHPSPTHIANPPIIHPVAMRTQQPLPQPGFPPRAHFMVNYGASPGQQYQLNSPPVGMQRFPQDAVPNITPHSQPPPLQPGPIPTLPQPNQSLPLQVPTMLSQQPPTPVQPLPQGDGGGGSLPAPGLGQPPPSQTYGGVTYYSPEQQQQGVKRVQAKRPVNPIRIEEPPQRSKRLEQTQENQEDTMLQQQQQDPPQQQQHQHLQPQVVDSQTT